MKNLFCLVLFHFLFLTTFIYGQTKIIDPVNHLKTADQLLAKGQLSQALTAYNKADSIFMSLDQTQNALDAKYGIIFSLIRLGEKDQAINQLQNAKKLSIQSTGESSVQTGKLLYLEGIIDLQFGRGNQIESILTKSIEIISSTLGKNDPFLGKCYNVLGIYYNNKKEFSKALTYYKQALDLKLNTLGTDHPSIGISYNNIGVVYIHLGDLEKAIFYYQKSLENKINALGNNHPRVSDSYFNIGQVYEKQENYDWALDYYKKAINIDQQQEENPDFKLAHRYTSLSNIYFIKNDIQKAIEMGKKSVAHYAQTDINPSFTATGHQGLGTIYKNNKNYQDALIQYQHAINIISGEGLDTISFQNPTINNAICSERLYQILWNKMITLKSHYDDNQETHVLEAALNTGETLIEAILIMQLYLTENESKFLFANQTREVFEKVLSYCHELYHKTNNKTYLSRAFSAYENSKSNILRRELHKKSTLQQTLIPDSIIIKINAQKEKVNEILLQLFNEKNLNKKTKLKINLFNAKDELEVLIKNIESENPTFHLLKEELKPLGIDNVQGLIKDKNEVIIIWFYGFKDLYNFRISSSEIHFDKVELPIDYFNKIVSFTNLIKDGNLALNKGLSKEIYQQFIDESSSIYQSLFPQQSKSYSSVLLIPDGILSILPFDILLTEKPAQINTVDYSNLPYFIKQSDIRYAYAPFLFNVKSRNKNKTKNKLLTVAPHYNSTSDNNGLLALRDGFSKLDFAQKEVKTIGELLPSENLNVDIGQKNNFIVEAQNYRFLHLAMHAFTDDENPSHSGLVFEDSSEKDATLYAYEIEQMQLPAEMVVLSACNTGSGKMIDGEGQMSLARSFSLAGAQNIVMSLWQADDESTSMLMSGFYKNITDGIPKSKALQEAKLAILNNGKKSFPFYWSSFVLFGDNEVVKLNDSTQWLYWVLGISVICLLIIVLRTKRS